MATTASFDPQTITIDELISTYNSQHTTPLTTWTVNSLKKKAEGKAGVIELREIISKHKWSQQTKDMKTKLLELLPEDTTMTMSSFMFPEPPSYNNNTINNISSEKMFCQCVHALINTCDVVNDIFQRNTPMINKLFEPTIDNVCEYIVNSYDVNDEDDPWLSQLQVLISHTLHENITIEELTTPELLRKCVIDGGNYPVTYLENRINNIVSRYMEHVYKQKLTINTNLTTNHKKNTQDMNDEQYDKLLQSIFSIEAYNFIHYVYDVTNVQEEYVDHISKFHHNVLNYNFIVSPTFNKSLCSFEDKPYNNINDYIKLVFDKKAKKCSYLNSLNLSERSNGEYRRFSIDIDCKEFNEAQFTRDIKYLNYYIHSREPFNNMKIYWSIDLAKDSISIYSQLVTIIRDNTTNFNNHAIGSWSNEHLNGEKMLSIHIYYPGYKFLTTQLKSFGDFLRNKVNVVYEDDIKTKINTYIDYNVYHRSQQMFRLPFSGKQTSREVMPGKYENKIRPAIDRVSTQLTSTFTIDELITFYSNCSLLPTKNDKYHNIFECYVPEDRRKGDVNRKVKLQQISELESSFIDPSSTKYFNFSLLDEQLLADETIYIPDNGSQLLINMMMEYINSIHHYQEHRKYRLMFINNCYAIGLNHATTTYLNASLGCNHTNGSNTENKSPWKDVDWVEDNLCGYKWTDKVFGPDHKKLFLTYNSELRSMLIKTTFRLDILRIILRHMYVSLTDGTYVYKTIDVQSGKSIFSDPTSISNLDTKHHFVLTFYTHDKHKIYKMKLTSLLNSEKITPCLSYDRITVGIDESMPSNINYFDTYTLPYHQGTKYTFKDRPAPINDLLHMFIDNNLMDYTQEELEERVNYFESAIAFKFQKPSRLPNVFFVLTTLPGLCKSTYARLLNEINPHVMYNCSLELETGQFNGAYLDKTILFYNEAPNTTAIGRMNTITTESYITVNRKFEQPQTSKNISLKIAMTNETEFSYITDKDRRYVVFSGTNTAAMSKALVNKPGYIFTVEDNRIINPELKEQYLDYLLNLKIPSEYNGFLSIPNKSCLLRDKEEYIMSRRNNKENIITFVEDIFEHCYTPIHTKSQRHVINSRYICNIITCLKRSLNDVVSWMNKLDESSSDDETENNYSDYTTYYNSLQKGEQLYFNSCEDYCALAENYLRNLNFWGEKTNWGDKIISRKLNSDNSFMKNNKLSYDLLTVDPKRSLVNSYFKGTAIRVFIK